MNVPLCAVIMITLANARMLCAQTSVEPPSYFGTTAAAASTPQSLASSADPQGLSALRREYTSRVEAAIKVNRVWYLQELNRLEKSLARGDLVGALAIQRERELMLIGGTWSWHSPGGKSDDEIIFYAGGNGKHSHSPFAWQASSPRTFTLTIPDGRRWVVTFNEAYTAYRCLDLDGHTPIEGERK